MSTAYKTIEYRLHESLIQVQEMLEVVECTAVLGEQIEVCKNLIKTKRYNIAVMGEFKRGKSSLINAILGTKILPADVTPATATINRITYGSQPRVVINYKDDSRQEIDIAALSDYVTKITAEGEARAVNIREAVVYFPTVICQNHIDIIDTPGLNDDEKMTAVTIEMLSSIDAVIVTIHARSPFSVTEKKFVCQLLRSAQIHNIIFVVTFIDQLDEEDYEYESFMEFLRKRIRTEVFAELQTMGADEQLMCRAEELLDKVNIFGVSAAQALKYFSTNNREALQQSRFEPFSSELLKIVTAKQLENAVRKTVSTVRQVIGLLLIENENRLQLISQQSELLQAEQERLDRYELHSKQELDGIFVQSYQNFIDCFQDVEFLKNRLINIFVQNLNMAPHTHEGIRSIIGTSAINCYEYLNKDYQPDIQGRLLQLNTLNLQHLMRYRQEHLRTLADKFGSIQHVPEELSELHDFAAQTMQDIAFTWQTALIPTESDLATYNPLQDIIKAVNISVDAYIQAYRDAQASIRKECFTQIRMEYHTLRPVLEARAQEEFTNMQVQLRSQRRTHQAVGNKAAELLQSNQLLWQEFNS